VITDGEAVTAVVDLLQAVATEVQILDAAGQRLEVAVFGGPTTGTEYAPLWLSAGTPWGEQRAVTTLEETRGGSQRARVTHTVACAAFVASGEIDWPEWRRQAGLLIAGVRDGIRRDRTLGGLVATARMGADRQMDQLADEQGVCVMAGFTVELLLL
jgi:hypothetical protein